MGNLISDPTLDFLNPCNVWHTKKVITWICEVVALEIADMFDIIVLAGQTRFNVLNKVNRNWYRWQMKEKTKLDKLHQGLVV